MLFPVPDPKETSFLLSTCPDGLSNGKASNEEFDEAIVLMPPIHQYLSDFHDFMPFCLLCKQFAFAAGGNGIGGGGAGGAATAVGAGGGGGAATAVGAGAGPAGFRRLHCS